MTEVVVTFSETVTRTITFDLELGELSIHDLDNEVVQELLDAQNAWDQPDGPAWLTGDVEERSVDEFAVFP